MRGKSVLGDLCRENVVRRRSEDLIKDCIYNFPLIYEVTGPRYALNCFATPVETRSPPGRKHLVGIMAGDAGTDMKKIVEMHRIMKRCLLKKEGSPRRKVVGVGIRAEMRIIAW